MAGTVALGQPLRGSVSQTGPASSVDDLLASCAASRIEADKGDCAKLNAYVAQNGQDGICLQWWRQAITLDRQIAGLSSRAKENTDPTLSRRQGELARQLATLESQIDQRCRPTGPPADEFAAGGDPGDSTAPPPIPPDEFGAGVPPDSWPPGPVPDQIGSTPHGNGTSGGTTGNGSRPPPPRPSSGSNRPTCDGPWIRTMHDMAVTVFEGYRPDSQPILLAALCDRPNTWLVTLSGYQSSVWGDQPRFGQLTGLQEIFAAALRGEDNYGFALVQHLQKRVPVGDRIIVAGHSLGGMVAQNLPVVDALNFRRRWLAARILTLGAPVMNEGQLPAALVRRFATRARVPIDMPDQIVLRAAQWAQALGLPGLFTPPNTLNTTWIDAGSALAIDPVAIHGAYPQSVDLKGYDAWGVSPGATYLHLDQTRMWRLPVGTPFPSTPPPIDRGMPLPDDRALRKMATYRQMIIIVRDSNRYAMRWVGAPGAAPKPVWIKDKTLKPGDCVDVVNGKKVDRRPDLFGLAVAAPDDQRSLAQIRTDYQSANIQVGTAADCYLLFTPIPGGQRRYYSDTDLHGVYARNPWTQQVTDAWSPNLRPLMNDKFLEQMIQHPPQDNWEDRNNHVIEVFGRQVSNGNYGPQPPATAYLPDGSTVHLENRWQMKLFYQSQKIPWMTIYPNDDEQ